MSDFVVSEAEESSGEESENEEVSRPKKNAILSESEDEEDEGEDLDSDLKDLIDDNPENAEDQASDEEGETGEKRKHDSDYDEDLEDEDLELIEENLGIKINRDKKRKRIRKMSSDEESGDEDVVKKDDRDIVANELFEDDEEETVNESRHEEPKQKSGNEFGDLDESEESDIDDFIVDGDDQPLVKAKKKKKHIIHDDKALQEAQDIFGVDFDYNEFEQYGDEYDEEEEEEYEDDDQDMIDYEGDVRPKTKKSKRKTAKTIYDVFEPSELEKGFFTDVDNQIRTADMPERFQLRHVAVQPADGSEVEEEAEFIEEAEWIYKYGFSTPPISEQEYYDNSDGQYGATSRRSPGTVTKIKHALEFMRNSQFEVPFIAFYRKEYVEPELNINDLWKIYHLDEKWMQLKLRKEKMVGLFEKMQRYQFDSIDPDKPLESDFRALTEEDVKRAKSVQTLEELRDVYQHFLLYYGSDIPKMKNALAQRKANEEDEQQDILKQATRKTGYNICQQAGLGELAKKFGLTPEQFGENLRDQYQRHEVDQDPAEPLDLAEEFINNQFKTSEEVLKGGCHMVAMQLAHDPTVRQVIRQVFVERAKIYVRPTKKGQKEIDEAHPCYTFKYLKNKPVKTLHSEQFLHISLAADDGLLEYEIMIDDKSEPGRPTQTYFDEIKPLYQMDEFSHLVQEWNNQRAAALERALVHIIYPQIVKEIQTKLLEEAKEHIMRACCLKLYKWLMVAPYEAEQQEDEDDMDYENHGLRVMALAYLPDREQAAFSCIVDGDGNVTDYIRLTSILKRKDSYREDERLDKEADLKKIKDFIETKKPHVIVVGSESREALFIVDQLREVVAELEAELSMAPIKVELLDNEVANVYMNSKKSEADFRDYPPLLRQAVSLARRMQDPLVEFCQLCNSEEDILALKFHPMQDQLNKDSLLEQLYLEFINRVNEVGVDVNRCVTHPTYAPLVQFVCGLGPRKGYHLIRTLKQNNSKLEARTQLVTLCQMGPKVFMNCAGFIKIDTNSLGESTDTYVEVLDGSRVHPETYDWARKMAVDALEYDDSAGDANPAGALEEILESPERLRDLDLDAFAEELDKQGLGSKQTTLYDIRAELNHRYNDLRTPYRSLTPEETFNLLTKETPATFYIGKLVLAKVTGFARKRQSEEEANPERNEETELWMCPFCKKNDFAELSDVWSHFDAKECPGQAIGVRCRLDNSCSGFIPLKRLSDKEVHNPEDRVAWGQMLHCRIMKIDITRFSVDLTCRSSDLADKNNEYKLKKDLYYDEDLENAERKSEEDKKKQKARQTYVKRVIAHPQFHNVDFKTCARLMENMEQGEVVIRPSSKGSDRLTVTWKVAEGVLQHIDVREEGKENAFSLGQSLWIEKEEFEDLDEIIARHIQPMAAFARDIINYKYYKETEGGAKEMMERYLVTEKKKAPSKIPYFFSATKQYPGKFLLSYMPRKSAEHEYVTVTPDGIRYRGQVFPMINSLISWFKEHFRDAIPGTPSGRTPSQRTPSMRTPVAGTPFDPATIQRAAAGLPSNVFNTLAQVAGHTPAGYQGFTPRYVPGQTPLITPMVTPSYNTVRTPAAQAASMTPRNMTTPQYTPTPRAAFATPRTNPGKSKSAGTDWAQAAQAWMKKTPTSSGKSRRTPRAGDSTPLFDER